MEKIRVLPKWVMPDTLPSVYDTQSGTTIEMTAKVYAAMRNLELSYNAFVDELNQTINEFINSTNKDQELFKEKINKIMHDYIIQIDEKIKMQDLVINDSIVYIKDNLETGITNVLNEMLENGELDQIILDVLSNIETSIEEITTKLTRIEGNINNLQLKDNELEGYINNLNTEVNNINNSRITGSYDIETETLTLLNLNIEEG